MATIIIEQIAYICGVFIGAIIVRYLMRLSTIQNDMRWLRYKYYAIHSYWLQGTFEYVSIRLRVRKLLDY